MFTVFVFYADANADFRRSRACNSSAGTSYVSSRLSLYPDFSLQCIGARLQRSGICATGVVQDVESS
eukprot:CAMPEP_0117586114 /NCGR_PEP_ID=MMETSP0784-20121206/68533_1 /TAXON_ID=39447 /ORGANISM="" /LENGTH=66 /DNA_ID=CAMNT_0005387161 /DNA_START=8 /DNA_END=205 /DNA_ORIENTATION=+